jgi:protein TonB
VHACLLAGLIFAVQTPAPEHQWVLAYVIDPGAVAGTDGQGSGGAYGAVAARLVSAPLSPPERSLHAESPHPPSAEVPAADSTDAPPDRLLLSRLDFRRAALRDERDGGRMRSAEGRATDSSRGAGAGPGSGQDPGDGSGSGGGSIAHADYGANPAPVYPPDARRRGEQGTVMMRVLVGADGAVVRAEISRSSGYRRLDDAALAAVRKRWRFVAARRDGRAVESWVIVPIRFALTEASAQP